MNMSLTRRSVLRPDSAAQRASPDTVTLGGVANSGAVDVQWQQVIFWWVFVDVDVDATTREKFPGRGMMSNEECWCFGRCTVAWGLDNDFEGTEIATVESWWRD